MSIPAGAIVGLLLMAAPVDVTPSDHPVPPQPHPESTVVGEPASVPTADRPGTAGSPLIVGRASWYGTGPGAGHAAAGPALRRVLGSGWRGTHLAISFGSRAVSVVVDDWCQCSWKKPGEKLIDLSDEDFSALASLSRGVITVEVTR